MFPHIPLMKSRKREALEILIPIVSPPPAFCVCDWPNTLPCGGDSEGKANILERNSIGCCEKRIYMNMRLIVSV